MKLSKVNGTFDVYRAEVSYAELIAIQTAAQKAPGPVTDELAKAIDWYIQNELPAPGQDKKDRSVTDDADASVPAPPGDGDVKPKPSDNSARPAAPAPRPSVKPPEVKPTPKSPDTEIEADADRLLPKD